MEFLEQIWIHSGMNIGQVQGDEGSSITNNHRIICSDVSSFPVRQQIFAHCNLFNCQCPLNLSWTQNFTPLCLDYKQTFSRPCRALFRCNYSKLLEFGFDKVKPWNGLWKRMDFRLEWIEILNFTISLLTEKMILILSIGMNYENKWIFI